MPITQILRYTMQTALKTALKAVGVQMAYRMAQVINLIVQNTADGAEGRRCESSDGLPLGTEPHRARGFGRRAISDGR